jgi:hypothetical protein
LGNVVGIGTPPPYTIAQPPLSHINIYSFPSEFLIVNPQKLDQKLDMRGGGVRMCSMAMKKSTNIQMEKSAKCEQYTLL